MQFHWIAQHLRLFLILISSTTCLPSLGGTTMPCCTSTTVGARLLGVPFKSAVFSTELISLLPFISLMLFTPLLVRDGKSAVSLVGVIGFPSFIRFTIMSASLLSSEPGLNGLSIPLSILEITHEKRRAINKMCQQQDVLWGLCQDSRLKTHEQSQHQSSIMRDTLYCMTLLTNVRQHYWEDYSHKWIVIWSLGRNKR